MLEMKLINPTHRFQNGFADCTRLAIGARPADTHQSVLLRYRRDVIAIDHRLTHSSTVLLSVPSKNHSPAPTARSSRADHSSMAAQPSLSCPQEHVGNPFLQRHLPVSKPVRMDIKLLGQLCQCFIPLYCR